MTRDLPVGIRRQLLVKNNKVIGFEPWEKEAAEYVERTDRVRKQYVRRYFGVNVADPHQYHLVINSGKVGYQEAAKIIVDAGSRHCTTQQATRKTAQPGI